MPETEARARMIQQALSAKVKISDDFNKAEIITGIDVGYDNERNLAHASVINIRLGDLKPVEQVQAFAEAKFPYIPGLLAFREIPAILAALTKLEIIPDILMVDGQGIAHPKHMGIAAHLGVLLDIPSIGVAKSRLAGKFKMPIAKKGENSPLMIGKEQVGVVLCSRDNTKPLFISPGHRISIKASFELTLRCLTRYRLPEPTRLADKLSKLKKQEKNQLQFI